MGAAAERPSCVVLLGAPGSGKGTQAALLAGELGVPAVSTGDMLRQAVADSSPLGGQVERLLAAGELVDDRTMARVVEERLQQPDAARGFILDGYPRTRVQADDLEAILGRRSRCLDAVVRLAVPEAELIARALGRKRADDDEKVVRRRLEVYRRRTAPLVEYYREQGLLREVDGHQPVEAVAASVRQALAEGNGWC